MAIVSKLPLLLDLNLYKEHNGYIIPELNEFDIDQGITTPEQKFEKWSYYTQLQLNAVLQDELAIIKYDLNAVKSESQYDIINIMVTRLIRAFYNDEILPRNASINFSQQGGQNYSSTGDIDPKDALYSFFDSAERLLIENSGITQGVFSSDGIIDDDSVIDNQFKSGEFVPDVDLRDFAKNIITVDGVNKTVSNAINDLNNEKVDKSSLSKEIEDATGFEPTGTTTDTITTRRGIKKITISDGFTSGKGDNDLSQMKDVKDAEARNRGSIVINQGNIASNSTKIQQLENTPASAYKSAIRKWIGSLDGTAQNPNDNVTTFDLSGILAEDGLPFDFSSGKDLKVWTTGISNTGTFGIDFNIQVGRTIPLVIEAITTPGPPRAVEIISGLLDTNGILTIQRNSGNFIEWNSLKIIELKEDILALANSLATKLSVENLENKKVYDETQTKLLKDLNVNDSDDKLITVKVYKVFSNGIGTAYIVNADGTKNQIDNSSEVAQKNFASKEYTDLKAKTDLSNINVGSSNAGKFIQIKSDGTLEYSNSPSGQLIEKITFNSVQDMFKNNLKKIEDGDEFIFGATILGQSLKYIKLLKESIFSPQGEEIRVSSLNISGYGFITAFIPEFAPGDKPKFLFKNLDGSESTIEFTLPQEITIIRKP